MTRLAAITFGIVIVMLLIVLSQKHDNGPLPLGATCSAVISAACHPPTADKDAHLHEVSWGEIPEMCKSTGISVRPGLTWHCPPRNTTDILAGLRRAKTINHFSIREARTSEGDTSEQSTLLDLDQEGSVNPRGMLVGHCSFTSFGTVQLPTEDKLYA